MKTKVKDMKKMFLMVAMMIATVGVAQANIQKNYDYTESTKIETLKDFVEKNDSTPHIISFYDVERIEIENTQNYLIRIYDENWALVKETTDSVNLFLEPGNYFVACETNFKTKYITH